MKDKFLVDVGLAYKLKHTGYNEWCDYYYDNSNQLQRTTEGIARNSGFTISQASAPTYHEVLEWLEGKGLTISVAYIVAPNYYGWKADIFQADDTQLSGATCPTRESALEDTILKALELL